MAERKKQKRPRRAADELPPIPSDEAVRLGALTCLMHWATGDPVPMHVPPPTFRLPQDIDRRGAVSTAEESFALMAASGESPKALMVAFGLTQGECAAALLHLCRGARVQWVPGKAVA